MDLIDRYLNAIRRNLPRDRADDIAAELRDLIASRVEDREDALGRALTPEEAKALLREFGHPLVVAARYRRQQWLIGPDVFPFYVSVLRIVMLIIAGVVTIGAVVNLVLNQRGPVEVLAQSVGSLFMSGLISVGIVTLVFVMLERGGFPADHVHRWDPGNLADIGDKQPGHWESAIEVALAAGFLIWWSGLVRLPFAAGGHGFRIEPAPVFTLLYWPIFALIAARLLHNLIQWLRPRWKRLRAALGVLTTAGGLVLLGLLYRAGQWASIVSTGMPADQAAQLQASLNLALRIAIVVAAVFWTLQGLQWLHRLWRRRFQLSPA
jgi:hypothetical protein